MDALQEFGIPGPDLLRDSLTTCSDPLTAIAEFQDDNGILLPSLRPMLPLLDLHGVRRLDFHTSVREELKDHLLKRINELGRKDVPPATKAENEKKLVEMLNKYFPVIRVITLQPVVMAILKNMDQVDDKFLKQLTNEKSLYEKCDVVVKRQIWQQHQGLFGDEVSPLLSQYIKYKESLLLKHEDVTAAFFLLTPRQRRQNETIQQLVQMVGKNVLLYDTILQFLRTLFLRTKNVHYCTLRVELLMALHDAEVQDITAMDPCHKFTWCLDACIREQDIDSKRSRELQTFLDSVRKGQEQVLGDLSMTLCDHYAVNFLSAFAIKTLTSMTHSESLARENTNLHLVLRMLNLGLHSWHILNTQNYKEPVLDPTLLTKFIPTLMSLMVDDQVRALNNKLPPDVRESALTIIEHSGPPPDSFVTTISDDPVAALLAIYYTIFVCSKKDKQAITRILGCMTTSFENKAYDNTFLHLLVSHLIPIADEFAVEKFCTVVLDDFFSSGLLIKNTAHHLMKLVLHAVKFIPMTRTEIIVKTLMSCSLENELSQNLRSELQDRISQLLLEESLPDEADKSANDFPIPVPTPSHA
jgi:negative elongation factor B